MEAPGLLHPLVLMCGIKGLWVRALGEPSTIPGSSLGSLGSVWQGLAPLSHDIQVQADVGLTGHAGEGVLAGVVQRWDLQHMGTLKVCVGTAPGQPRAAVPRVPTGINLLAVLRLGNLLENALGSCGHVGCPGHWGKLVF